MLQVFHICNPVYNNDGGLDRMDKYSFVCGEGTQFDQSTLTCNYPLVGCSALQYRTLQCRKVPRNAVQFSTVGCSTVCCNAVQCNAVYRSTVQSYLSPLQDSFPCEESPSLYGAVEFGKIPDSDY